jgi:hypothetical protein
VANAEARLKGTGKDPIAEKGARDGEAWARAFKKASDEFLLSAFQASKGVDLSRSQGGVLNLMNQPNYGSSVLGQGAAGEAALLAMGGTKTRDQVEESKKIDAEMKKQAKSVADAQKVWENYGKKVGSIMGDLISGHKKMGQALREALTEMGKAFLQYVVKSVMGSAAIAGAHTEEQMSTTGPFGWAAGLPAMAMVVAAVQALLGGIGSAAGGWDLPASGGTFPAVLHPREMVLPAEHADTIRSLKDGGGFTLHLNALDAKSSVDWIERNPRVIEMAFRRAAQRGGMHR